MKRSNQLSHPTKLTVVIPARDEKEGIGKTIRAIPKAELERMGYQVQILVVDSSTDNLTAEIAENAGAQVISEPRIGYGRAYKTGFAHAEGEIIATADADMTYPVEDIPKFVRMIEEENLDFITTNRFAYMDKGAMSFRNRVGNSLLSLAMRLLFWVKVKDSQSGMWVFRRDILDRVVLRSDKMSFSEEFKIEARSSTAPRGQTERNIIHMRLDE